MFEKMTTQNVESDKQNLYDELAEILSSNHKTVDDIEWVECVDCPAGDRQIRYSIPKDNFITVAKNTWYDPYEWRIQIPTSLKIYGKNRSFLIDVFEYDGRQNLEYINMEKTIPKKQRMVESLTVDYGDYDYKPKWSKE